MTPKKIVVHCSASKNLKTYDISAIDRYHKSIGWSGVGYHAVIQPDGLIQYGRSFDKTGAHVEGHNKDSLGFCLIGTDKFTKEQFESLRAIIKNALLVYKIPAFEIYCHYEFDSARKQGKTCPNIRAANLVHWYLTGDNSSIKDYLNV